MLNRCSWCNVNNPLYVKYHDEEWGVLRLDDHHLFEMLILEGLQAGLSWECVLNKRVAFCRAYDNFNVDLVAKYNQEKVDQLANDTTIIRNRRKIGASVNNAQIFKRIASEYGSFANYLRQFWDGQVVYEYDHTTSVLSDQISADLKSRGMTFVGSTIIYAYLQAVGIINGHEPNCFMYNKSYDAASIH